MVRDLLTEARVLRFAEHCNVNLGGSSQEATVPR